MLKALKFVQGGVASKDFVPELMHFRIEKGFIRSYNGAIGLGAPIGLDLEVSPKGTEFLEAIQTCKSAVQLHVTPAGKLAVKSGKFKAFVECCQEPFPDAQLEGLDVPLNGALREILKTLAPFIAEDASRPWARGILFQGESAFATNNICLVEQWTGLNLPIDVNIPRATVMELIRVGEEPTRMTVAENRATFFFEDGKWLSTQLYPTTWPDLDVILGRESNQIPLPEDFLEAVEDLSPFVDDLGRIFFNESGMATSIDDGSGASVDLEGLGVETACFHFKQLLLLKVAKTIDFSAYPAPCLFKGEQIRGAIMGMKF